jgi:DNA repair exonuclease SbcCD ATPase subunit
VPGAVRHRAAPERHWPRGQGAGRRRRHPHLDPRNLLRRGTGSGFAEVDFVGIDGRRYRARWEANRARDKANGKLQHSRQSLYDLDSEQLLAAARTNTSNWSKHAWA